MKMRRIVSLFITFAMLFTMMPNVAFARDDDTYEVPNSAKVYQLKAIGSNNEHSYAEYLWQDKDGAYVAVSTMHNKPVKSSSITLNDSSSQTVGEVIANSNEDAYTTLEIAEEENEATGDTGSQHYWRIIQFSGVELNHLDTFDLTVNIQKNDGDQGHDITGKFQVIDPDAPTFDDIKDLLKVKVECDDVEHFPDAEDEEDEKTYTAEDSSVEDLFVEGNFEIADEPDEDGKWEVTLTGIGNIEEGIPGEGTGIAAFVDQFDTDCTTDENTYTHKVKADDDEWEVDDTIYVKNKNGKWELVDNDHFEIDVECDDTPAPVEQYKITVDVENGSAKNSSGQSITSGSTISVEKNGSVTLSFTAKDGYALDTVTVDGNPDVLTDEDKYTFSNVQTDRAIKVVFSEDTIGGEGPNKGDGIPDKYQATVTYKIVNGTWGDTDANDKKYVFNLKEKNIQGEWVNVSTTPTLEGTIPTGMTPNNGYEGGSWNAPAPTASTAVTKDVIYIYTYTADPVVPDTEDAYFYVLNPDFKGDPTTTDTDNFYYVGQGGIKENPTEELTFEGNGVEGQIYTKPSAEKDDLVAIGADEIADKVGPDFENVFWYRTKHEKSGANNNTGTITTDPAWHVDGILKPEAGECTVLFLWDNNVVYSATVDADTKIDSTIVTAADEAALKAAGKTADGWNVVWTDENGTQVDVAEQTGESGDILVFYAGFEDTNTPVNKGGSNEYVTIPEPTPNGDGTTTTQSTVSVHVYRDGKEVTDSTGASFDIKFAGDSASVDFTTTAGKTLVGTNPGQAVLSSVVVMRNNEQEPNDIIRITGNGAGKITEIHGGASIYLFYSTVFKVEGTVEVDGKSVGFGDIVTQAAQDNNGFISWYQSARAAMYYADGTAALKILSGGNITDSRAVAEGCKFVSDSMNLIDANKVKTITISNKEYVLENQTVKVWNGTKYQKTAFGDGTERIVLWMNPYWSGDQMQAREIIDAAIAENYTFKVKVEATEKVETFNLYGWFADNHSGLDENELEAYAKDPINKYISPNWEQRNLEKGSEHTVTFTAPAGYVLTGCSEVLTNTDNLIGIDGKGKTSYEYTTTGETKSDGTSVADKGSINVYAFLAKDKNGDLIPDYRQIFVNYSSDDTRYGTVSRDQQVFTFTDDEIKSGKLTEKTLSAEAIETSDGDFDRWTSDDFGDLFPQRGATLDVDVTFTVGQLGETFDVFANFDRETGGGGAHHPDAGDNDDDDDDDDDTEEIIDEEVPLAETPWLNTEDHYAYIVGYSEDGTVRPNANITRAEVATIFFRLLTDEARDQFWMTTNPFSDVLPNDWYNNAVSTMVNMGIIQGYEDGTFRPNANITRAEFAAIAARFMASGYDVEDDLFVDIANHWARESINDAAMAGWIHGYAGDIFRPDAAITRAEAVTLVNNVLQRKPDADHMLDTMIKWPDNPEGTWYYEAIQEATNSHDYDLFEDAEYETWTALQPNRDWAALEADWVNTHRAGGEVM